MLRFLVYGLSNQWGGVETIVLSLIARMNDSVIFDILLSRGDCAYEDKLSLPNVQIKHITSWGSNPIRFSTELKRIYEHSHYDFLWVNASIMSNYQILSITKKYSDARLIVHSHGSYFEAQGIRSKILLCLHYLNRCRYIKNSDYHWACSQKSADWFYGKKWQKKYPVFIVKNGLSLDKFHFDTMIREEYRNRLNLNEKYMILHVGRLCAVKNQHFVIDVFYELQKVNNNMFLLIIGEGELKKDLEEHVRDLDISQKVLFLGKRDDVASLLQAADLFLLPSLHEGLSMVAIEAQASGLPFIASTGVPEEAKVIKDMYFLSLSDSAKEWSDFILSQEFSERIDCCEKIRHAGYAIDDVVKAIKQQLKIM